MNSSLSSIKSKSSFVSINSSNDLSKFSSDAIILDIDALFYQDCYRHGRGRKMSRILQDNSTVLIRAQKNGMFLIEGEYGILGWVNFSYISMIKNEEDFLEQRWIICNSDIPNLFD